MGCLIIGWVCVYLNETLRRYFLKCSTMSISYQQCIKIILHFYHYLVFVFKFKFTSYVIFQRHIMSFSIFTVLCITFSWLLCFITGSWCLSFPSPLLHPYSHPVGSHQLFLYEFVFSLCCLLDSHNGQNDHHQNIWRGCGEKGILLHCQWECNSVHYREEYGGSSES